MIVTFKAHKNIYLCNISLSWSRYKYSKPLLIHSCITVVGVFFFCLMTAFQSVYRKHHSTESALLNIHNDILLNMAKGSVTALTLLDLSAAFDTIDHTVLLDTLNVYYVISKLALGWFKSYLSGKTHSVKVGSTLSHPAALQYGVPQGSVLGPILFSLYTNPISSVIHSHSSINHHFYADDTQLYITLSPTNFSHSIQKLKNCLNDIQNLGIQ